MLKPITIKIDDELWAKFKANAKRRGIRLEAALDFTFRNATRIIGRKHPLVQPRQDQETPQ